ncbi:hypothetical protein [Maliponia aquimaris]|uniref:TFIIB zinc-binding protein n=1 Tax=Maliponia aquimaris TaxID=1673631 RepID=A0A238KIA1_9RHOB|nr:hypothetical protein [Maliponia aquimaris]SMX42430.1 hypothetical protein MAA8898_02603 [Maliponia aquimaris]
MPTTKIATCCYCGTRAALVLKGRERHELACSACGAPLHDLKMLKTDAAQRAPTGHRQHGPAPVYRDKPRKVKKPKRRKSLVSRIFDEAFDVIEDIFD